MWELQKIFAQLEQGGWKHTHKCKQLKSIKTRYNAHSINTIKNWTIPSI